MDDAALRSQTVGAIAMGETVGHPAADAPTGTEGEAGGGTSLEGGRGAGAGAAEERRRSRGRRADEAAG